MRGEAGVESVLFGSVGLLLGRAARVVPGAFGTGGLSLLGMLDMTRAIFSASVSPGFLSADSIGVLREDS